MVALVPMLATSTFVLSVIEVRHNSNIPQALRFGYYLSALWKAERVGYLCHADEA